MAQLLARADSLASANELYFYPKPVTADKQVSKKEEEDIFVKFQKREEKDGGEMEEGEMKYVFERPRKFAHCIVLWGWLIGFRRKMTSSL
jgi:hypothetical protein